MTYVYKTIEENQGPYEMIVVASERDTLVSIQLKGASAYHLTFNGITYSQGDNMEITLDRYEVAQVN